ncbi:hypothetical protein AYO40_03600 [Planctomycetaceae bacterium SCGC AG-212-D15]|nr:hypothetical protein AYO40_03600 [Planctomycetaceae bacterium SCGC AG-212-D15]
MDKILHTALLNLSNEVEATAIPSDCKHTAAWCLGKLPGLYAHYGSTHESRYGDEITRLVQVLIAELTRSQGGCKEAQAMACGMAARFQTLHERLSLPILLLKAPVLPAAPVPIKATRSRARAR